MGLCLVGRCCGFDDVIVPWSEKDESFAAFVRSDLLIFVFVNNLYMLR